MTDLDRYISSHTTSEGQLLTELSRVTHQRVVQPRMLSGHVQGQLLKMLTQMMNPRKVLEIGTFTGYSALCIASGLGEGAELHTIEVDDELESLAASFFERSEHSKKIHHHIGSALDIVPELGVKFDMVFMDGDKREYPAYYNMLMDGGYLGGGSVILSDNILWSGKVVEPLQKNDKHTRALLEFNDMVVRDERVECVILPIRDGLTLIRVK
ncbi:MAG: class I SAM-dependent methyltransferase [Rikenellaceae bacterium]